MEKEKFDLENFPTNNSAKKMLSYVTDGFYDKSYVGKWLYQVMGLEYDEAQKLAETLPEQFFPETATWGLMWHERKWNLPVRENLSYQERRRLICLKRDYRAPMTPYRMEKYLEDTTGFEVRIADVNDPGDYEFIAPHPNIFKAYFIGDGMLDSQKVHEILNQLKQSHITYIVNNRVILEMNNQLLQKIILRKVVIRLKISFWDIFCFDGSWLLDDTVILNAKQRYGLVVFIQNSFTVMNQLQNVNLQSIHIKGKQYIQEIVNVEDYLYLTIFQTNCINHRKINLRVCFNMSKNEMISDVVIETKTPDYWFLDGSLLLDGSRKLNSIYKKEIAI